ncbi:site-specific DNA-methyltransferase [Curtobacterium albidum]|uniref:DNA-methyltransferase n=1 Tax=Curtobacterium citreum TaxID=2036 RepID=UPI002026DC12|nr:site-specific DNA-methyltransferase [Curtobacterium albidum]MCL9665410.1 site-specific DNA-methyltransferase [Curtobacterium albidum]
MRNEVVLGDCIEELQKLPENSAQLIIADPPYNIGPAFGIEQEWKRSHDWLPWVREWLTECERVLAPGGSIFVYGIHHFIGFVQVEMYNLGLEYRRMFIWNYENGWSRSVKLPATHYEPVLWFTKGEAFTYHVIREPYKSTDRLKHTITKNGKVWTPHPDGRMAGDVWRFPTLAGRRFREERVNHPTQKPLALTDRIVRHFSNEGDLVVVPFAGSGTECVSAARNGRHYWACDIKSEYVELAKRRLASTESDRVPPLPED